MAIERCQTGVPELDDILRGGIPRSSITLLAGGSGTGKTTLALQFLAHGAQQGEAGLFLSVTEPLNILERNAREYAFVQPAFLNDGRLRLVDLRAMAQRMGIGGSRLLTLEDGDALVSAIASIVEEYRIRRLVLDSITAVCQRLEEPGRIRDFVFRLGLELNRHGCTAILTSETPPRTQRYSMFGVEEFIADGIIFLSEAERHNDLVRTLQVIKMRGTDHSRSRFLMDLSDQGIALAPLLKKFGEAS